MRPSHYQHLLATARRATRRPEEAEDLVQDALLEALRIGRDPNDIAYLCGIIRNKATMAARTALRRRRRESHWQALRTAPERSEPLDIAAIVSGLPRSLKAVAALALSGHDRREIVYLLRLPDTALRQRILALKRHLRAMGLPMPTQTLGLTLGLDYGRIRDALLPGLLRQGGILASHDPDGHFFILKSSQTRPPRQQDAFNDEENEP